MTIPLLVLIISIQIIPTSFINAQSIHTPLPVLLIHGYASDASIWNEWKSFLDRDHIPNKLVTFASDDPCGSSIDHAKELNKIVNEFKSETGSPKINIVAHSKGGLDARVYLANNLSNANVANLIMIGTPNKGTPIADEMLRAINVNLLYLILLLILQYSMWQRILILTIIQLRVFGNQHLSPTFLISILLKAEIA